jgi:hypothetical protein
VADKRDETRETSTAQDPELPPEEEDPPLSPTEEEARRVAVKAAFKTLSNKVMLDVLKDATATAYIFCRNVARAEELASEAVTLILEDQRKWNPARRPLALFARMVAKYLALDYQRSAQAQHEVAPDSERDAEVRHEAPTVEELAIEQDDREAGQERFAEIMDEVKDSPKAMALVRATQQQVWDAKDQAVEAEMPETVIYAVRRRVGRAVRRVYERHPEACGLPKRKARGVHVKDQRATNEDESDEGSENEES